MDWVFMFYRCFAWWLVSVYGDRLLDLELVLLFWVWLVLLMGGFSCRRLSLCCFVLRCRLYGCLWLFVAVLFMLLCFYLVFWVIRSFCLIGYGVWAFDGLFICGLIVFPFWALRDVPDLIVCGGHLLLWIDCFRCCICVLLLLVYVLCLICGSVGLLPVLIWVWLWLIGIWVDYWISCAWIMML